MSYSMTHIVIAKQYLQRHKMNVSESALFLLASISPDAVHANTCFHKEMKEQSHFMPKEIQWGNIYLEEQMDAWYKEVRKFYKDRNEKKLTSLEQAFLNGYTLHLLIDIFNCQWFYAPNLIQFGLDVTRFRKEYREQSIAYDQYLYQSVPDSKKMFESMRDGMTLFKKYQMLESLGFTNVLTEEAIQKNIDRTMGAYENLVSVSIPQGTMITIEDSDAFIKEMGVQCDEILYTFPEKEHLFQVKGTLTV